MNDDLAMDSGDQDEEWGSDSDLGDGMETQLNAGA